MHIDMSAIGCQREFVDGKRVKTCVPVENWREVIAQAGVGKAKEVGKVAHDEL